MNCVNHPETPVSAFCQHCGKALCAQCVRPVQGVIFCESCLAARLTGAARYTVNIGGPGSTSAGGFQYSESGPLPGTGYVDGGPRPSLAGFLGFIPGVGAMYNGQFIKALVHVLVFVVLISLSHASHIFGIFIGAWVLYQVFDGYQTAKARRDGLPLPDPFGLNELGNRMTGSYPGSSQRWTPQSPAPPPSWGAPAGTASGFTDPGAGPMTGQTASWGPAPAAGFDPESGYAQPGPPPYSEYAHIPVPPNPPVPPSMSPPFAAPPFVPRRSGPVGAVVLIGLGLLFLFSTTGFLDGEWISHGWPLVLIGIGAWMVIRRLSEARK